MRISGKQFCRVLVSTALILMMLGTAAQPASARKYRRKPNPPGSPPAVAVVAPTAGATLSGTVTVAGTAWDGSGIARVDVAVDDGAFESAVGTTDWSYALDASSLPDASHTITARAVDFSGESAMTSVEVVVSNGPPASPDHMVTPEGVTIDIAPPVTGWTAQQVYDLLKPSAYQLSLLGPDLTVKVQTTYPSSTTTSVGTNGSAYEYFKATIYLDARSTAGFLVRPDYTIAHEYGHAWTLYHLYMTHQKDWTPWLEKRGLLGDTRLDTSYRWGKTEMIADDYRMLFGSPTAVSQANYINSQIPDPRTVPGLKDWFITTWA